jgi:hypothetical protein
MSAADWQIHCITCGEWWWSEDEAPACTCEDGGNWEADRAPRNAGEAGSS